MGIVRRTNMSQKKEDIENIVLLCKKGRSLSDIIKWLKTTGLYKNRMKIVALQLIIKDED
jgi:hypothetical protein